MFQLTFAVMNGFTTGMAVFLVASGLTLVFGILKVMNFSHGAFFMVGAYVAYSILGDGTPTVFELLVAAVGAGLVVAALGWLTDWVVLKRLMAADEHYVLIATFALLMLMRGATKLVWGVDFHSVNQPEVLSGITMIGGVPVPLFSMLIMGAGVVLFLLLDLVLHRAWVGKIIQSIANDRWMTALLGYNVPALFTGAVVIAFGLAGIAGGLLLPNQGLSPELGDTFVMLCFIVCVVGGLGSIRGAFIAAILLGVVEGLSAIYLSQFPGIGLYLFLIVVLLLRPQGLAGSGDTGPRAAAMGNLFGSVRRRLGRPEASGVAAADRPIPAGVNLAITDRPIVRTHLIAGALLVVALALVPVTTAPALTFIIGLGVIQAVFALSWYFLFSYAGVASFGHAAFFAIGAYGTGWMLKTFPEVSVFPILALVAAVAATSALVVGIIALRRASGLHLAILTMALAELLRLIISYTPAFGRDDGMSGIPRPDIGLGLFQLPLIQDNLYFWYVLVFCTLLAAMLWWLMHSSFGRALKCVAQDPERAAFIGIDVFRYRLVAFMISAAVAAICGGLMSPFAQIVTPEVASLHNSMAPVLNTLLGGAASFWGPMIGAAIFSGITFATRTLVGLSEVVVGGILLTVVLTAPTGVMGFVRAALDRQHFRRTKGQATVNGATAHEGAVK